MILCNAELQSSQSSSSYLFSFNPLPLLSRFLISNGACLSLTWLLNLGSSVALRWRHLILDRLWKLLDLWCLFHRTPTPLQQARFAFDKHIGAWRHTLSPRASQLPACSWAVLFVDRRQSGSCFVDLSQASDGPDLWSVGDFLRERKFEKYMYFSIKSKFYGCNLWSKYAQKYPSVFRCIEDCVIGALTGCILYHLFGFRIFSCVLISAVFDNQCERLKRLRCKHHDSWPMLQG